MEERREFPRLNYNVEVEWKKIGHSEGDASLSKNATKNISEGGMCLEVDSTVQSLDILALKITLPTKIIIHTKSVVRWVENFGIEGEKSQSRYEAGVKFMDISDTDRQEIKKFVFSILGANK